MSHRRRPHAAGPPPISEEGGGGTPPQPPGKAPRIRPWAERRVLALALAFRAANALLVRTYFNPDEHWQCLEVAHRIAFGYGHLTWEWKRGLRSYLHPLIFAALYKLLAFLHLDTPWFMAMAPRLLQSVFAAFGDLYLYKLSKLIFNEHVAQWTLFSQLVNWFMFFCITRTLSNSLETVLTLAGLYYWFIAIESSKGISVISKQQAASYQSPHSRKVALLIAALACAIRPTSAITWLYVGLLDFIYIKSKCRFLFLEVIPIGAIVLAATTFLDWWMYGSRVIVPLNFLKFNLFSSGGDYYGTHVFHWYFTQGFPSMIWTFLPLSVYGVIKSREWRISGLVAWVLGVYSILGHKEFRFVLPVLPLALMFSGYFLAAMSQFKGKNLHGKRDFSRLQLSVIFLIITNVPMALYMSLFHQRGTEDVMFYLSKEAHNGRVKGVLFLMPCHSTPYYSTLHSNLPMRFLDCTPSDNKGTLDESDRFLMNPLDFVGEVFGNLSSFSHIVLFESEERHVIQLLLHDSFQEVRRFFHSHFKIDRDLQSSVVVYSRRDVL
ncbi:mannosyltransferase APTG1-like [Hordeum vulgare subsp. vulgare]|uniref:Mannosyltransferase n=1 Tax=Hordeum vulgare subsp. vulgare TaxID=112509 RepID=A0A8I6YNW9_HORVV|nr:mannosyltransferase APTG1-like [Hordeum vulgare subsp. vulgare]